MAIALERIPGTIPQRNAQSLPRVSEEVPPPWDDPERWLQARAAWWFGRLLQQASSTPRRSVDEPPPVLQPLEDLLAALYPREGHRGPVPFPPGSTSLYLAWRARRLIAQGLSGKEAFATLKALFGPSARLPGRPDRILAQLDDLIRRIRDQDGWRVPAGLEPRAAVQRLALDGDLRIVPDGTDDAPSSQYNASRRKERGGAQRKMLTRLAKLNAKLPAEACPTCDGGGLCPNHHNDQWEPCLTCDDTGFCLACDASGLALMTTALRDHQMRQLAATLIPTVRRPRGRPPNGAVPQLENQPGRIADEIAEAVARYTMWRSDA